MNVTTVRSGAGRPPGLPWQLRAREDESFCLRRTDGGRAGAERRGGFGLALGRRRKRYVVAAVAVVRGGATAGCTLRGGGGGAPSPQCRHRLPATHGSGQWGRHAKQQQPPGRGVGSARAEPAHDPARPVCVGAGQRRAHRLLRDPDSAVRVRAASDGALLRGALLRGAGGAGGDAAAVSGPPWRGSVLPRGRPTLLLPAPRRARPAAFL